MRDHVHMASRRRDNRLAMIRKLTVWITGGAAAASLGLGAAFAHAMPGHAATSTTNAPQSAATPTAPANSGSASSAPANSGSTSPSASKSTQLTQPQQQPTHTTAPPVVTSGGS